MPLNLVLAEASATHVIEAMRRADVEHVLLPLLVQLAVIVIVARGAAVLFRRFGQPSVVGEIIAGLLLGPSVFGWLWPTGFRLLFHPGVAELPPESGDVILTWILRALSQLGLVLLLFLMGLEFDFSHLRVHGKSAATISVLGIACPFALGFGLGAGTHGVLAPDVPWLAFALFIATALSITAIPVLGRIMLELNLTRTRLGAITISAAAVDDATGWILLTTVAAIAKSQLDLRATFWMVAETVAFAVAMVFVARPILRNGITRTMARHRGELTVNALAAVLTLVLLCAIVTNLIGIFAIFGAFLLGATLSTETAFRQAVRRRLHDLVSAFFLPIFFTYTGLRTNIGFLGTWQLWGLCLLMLAAAVVGKLGGCGLAARLTGFSWRESGCIGAMMNTRGLMELIVINVGKDLGVIPDSVYCMLVLMAIATTMMTTPLVMRWMHGTELEPHVARSAFRAAFLVPQGHSP